MSVSQEFEFAHSLPPAKCFDCRVEIPKPEDRGYDDQLCARCRAVRLEWAEIEHKTSLAASYIQWGGPEKVLFELRHDAPQEVGAFASVRRKVDAMLAGESEVGGLFFHGNVGCGKTTEVGRLLWSLCCAGGRFRFKGTARLMDEFRGTFSNESLSIHDMVSNLVAVPVLVLDDIGTERASGWVLEKMFELIDSRGVKPTLYTSNEGIQSLGARLAESGDDKSALRVASRIADGCVEVPVPGGDRRGGDARYSWADVMMLIERLRTYKLSADPIDSLGPVKPVIEPWKRTLCAYLAAPAISADRIHAVLKARQRAGAPS